MSTSYDKLYNIRVRLEKKKVDLLRVRARNARRSISAEVGIAVDRYLEQGSVFDPLPSEEEE